jgi:acyl-CoA dehydrogenase
VTSLSGGVFAADRTIDEDADLRRLVDDLGRRSYDASLGRRGVPDRFDADLWRHLEETGLARLTTEGGAGPRELAVVLYGLGRHACAAPLAETDLLSGWLADYAGIEVPDGPMTVAVADGESSAGRVTGTAHAVPWARACAGVLLAVNASEGARVGILDASSYDLREAHNLAGEPRDEFAFDVPAYELRDVDPTVLTELAVRGAWARCVQTVGTLDAAVALSVDHTRERVQFGRALSAFQSVQQSLAGMAGEVERARAATELAVGAAVEHGFGSHNTEYAVMVAKVTVGRVVRSVTTIAHQLHGAIGVTGEHPLWLFTMRAQSWTDDFGTTVHHARRLGRLVLAADDPWDLITGEVARFEKTTAKKESS